MNNDTKKKIKVELNLNSLSDTTKIQNDTASISN